MGGLRVTYVGPVPPIASGIAQHGRLLVAALRDRGAEVAIVSWSSQYPPLLYKGLRRDPDARAPLGARFLLRWWDPVSWVRAGRAARGSDLLVFQWVTPVHAAAQRTIAKVAGVPAAFVVHNLVPHERMPFDELLARWVLRRAARVVTHSEQVLGEARALLPEVEGVEVPLPPLIPLVPAALPARPPLRLLCLGLVRHYKGFDLAVDAVRLLARRGLDVELTVAGTVWSDRQLWQERVSAPDLNGRVRLIDRYLSDGEIGDLLRGHHVVVLPYRSATQSGVAPLAYAAGRPIVATRVGGLAEAVLDGTTGRLAAPDDPEAIADAVAAVAADLDRYAAAAGTAAPRWGRVADAVLETVTSRATDAASA